MIEQWRMEEARKLMGCVKGKQSGSLRFTLITSFEFSVDELADPEALMTKMGCEVAGIVARKHTDIRALMDAPTQKAWKLLKSSLKPVKVGASTTRPAGQQSAQGRPLTFRNQQIFK